MRFSVLFLLLLFLTACETITDDPVFDEVPAIYFEGVSQDTIVQFTEQLIVSIRYEDGDGNLGTSDPDINSIFVQDSRLENPDEYYLPPLAPEDAQISITGTYNLKLSPTFLLGNGSQEIMDLEIYMVDRAGNQSNKINTGQIIVKKE
ncbi:MAG: hypothetical protein GYB31_14335 [Bacteroidetes bacterium]|nr:hypothetical protein [Bacteroidota bacterium]